MIITVTPNTAIDHILYVPGMGINRTIRARQVMESIAGKATDASWILGEMGIPSIALGFAAGLTGKLIERILREKCVETRFTEVEGDSRRNIVIVDESGSGQMTITAPTLRVNPAQIAALRQEYIAQLDQASCVVLGGTLPPGVEPAFYTELIGLARQRSIAVIFDASEPYLSAGLAAQPTFIKPNGDELGQIAGQTVRTIEEAHQAGAALQQRYGTAPIITLGHDGGLAILPEGTYRIPALEVAVVNTAGAGDAILAGLAASIEQGKPILEGLRLGFAAATAVVTMPGTAQCSRAAIECYAAQIKIIPYEKPPAS